MRPWTEQKQSAMKPLRQSVVFADDLSGALEVGVLARRSGFSAEVFLHAETSAPPCSAAQVVVIDTLTRECSPSEARNRLAAHSSQWTDADAGAILKKTDSLLRGNLAVELDFLRAAYPARPLIYVPAYPLLGRIVQDGILKVRNIAGDWEERADVLDTLAAGSAGPRPRLLRSLRELATALENGDTGCMVSDGATQDEVDEIARLLRPHLHRVMVAGPSGVFRRLFGEPADAHEFRSAGTVAKGGIALIGSFHPVTMEQLSCLHAKGRAVVSRDIAFPASSTGDGLDAELRTGWRFLCPHWAGDSPTFGSPGGPGAPNVSAQTEALRELARRVLALPGSGRVPTYLLCGGDTAELFLAEAGVTRLVPRCEVLPGVVLSDVVMNDTVIAGRPACIVTKSGAFGERDTFERVIDMLQGEEAPS